MGRIVEGQIIATTQLDSHGEQLSDADLEGLFRGWRDDLHVGVSHDLSAPPLCRAFNKRLDRLPDGTLAFKVDLEIFNEQAFSKFGGFSIGFSRRHLRIGRGEPECQLTINARQFDFAATSDLARLASEGHVIEVVERVEKIDVATTAIVVIALFAVKETASGFFKSIGSSLYDVAKRLTRKDSVSAPTNVHFHLHLDGRSRVPIIVVVTEPNCTVEDIRLLNEAVLRQRILERVALNELQRATARLLPGGQVDIAFITNRRGDIVYKSESGTNA